MITGAQQGLGRAIALRLAAYGAQTVVTDLDQDECEKVLQEIRDAGGVGYALRMDVCVEEEIRESMERVRGKIQTDRYPGEQCGDLYPKGNRGVGN